jgi:hypothetical protein
LSEQESTPVPLDIALQVARSLLDGASPKWIAQRFNITLDDVEWSRQFAETTIIEYYRKRDVPITDFQAFCQEHMKSVLSLLLDWTERLRMPVIEPAALESEPEDDAGKKNGTSQGETGDTPDSP